MNHALKVSNMISWDLDIYIIASAFTQMNRTCVSAEVKEFSGKMSLPDNYDTLK